MIADPATGAWIADSYNLDPTNPWEVAGGTSLSAPTWAGLIALADQARVAAGGQTLGSAGPTEAQQALYTSPVTDFNAVTTGNNGYSAGPGYNLVGGLGTPIANLLVPDLAAYAGSTAVPAGRIALSAAEATLSSGNFGATNALTGVANAFTVADVEIATASGQVHFLSSAASAISASPTSAASNADGTLRGSLNLFSPSETGTSGEAAAAGATLSVTDRLSSVPSSLASLSPIASRRSSWRASGLDGETLDTLFSASGADSSPFASDALLKSSQADPGEGWLLNLSANARMAARAQPVAGDVGAAQPQSACTRCRDSVEPATRAAAASVISPAVWVGGSSSSTDATPGRAVQNSAVEESDQLIEAVDAVAEKSAEAAGRAYESLVDALFGLIG
jgi:hypothetical protein